MQAVIDERDLTMKLVIPGLKPRPNGKCLAIKHDQTLFGDQTC